MVKEENPQELRSSASRMRSMSFLLSRQGNKHSRTAGTGAYPKCAIELPHPLSHPGNSNSERYRALDVLELFSIQAVTIVIYFEDHFLPT